MNFVTDIKFRCNIRPKRSIDVRQSLVSGLWTPVVRVSIMLSLMPAMLHIQCFRLVQIQKQQQQQQRNRNYHCYSYVMFSVSVMIASVYWLWTCTHKITGVYAMYMCMCVCVVYTGLVVLLFFFTTPAILLATVEDITVILFNYTKLNVSLTVTATALWTCLVWSVNCILKIPSFKN